MPCLAIDGGRLTLTGSVVQLSVPDLLMENEWVHVAMVFNRDQRQAAIFVNGEKESVSGLSPFFGDSNLV